LGIGLLLFLLFLLEGYALSMPDFDKVEKGAKKELGPLCKAIPKPITGTRGIRVDNIVHVISPVQVKNQK
jgi:hypothetical protein